MNISALGKIDLVKNEVDATIGVQPLQTVGKVVNRIPVVGWILTGKGKTFLTAYFEAKGRLEDPVVKAIPVKIDGQRSPEHFHARFRTAGETGNRHG